MQTPELTVRESILFSARLRLDPDTIKDDKEIQNFVEHILEAVEMKSLAGVLVGTDETLGLSFEQKKRLSIAVELAASPSILFLDEPVRSRDAIFFAYSGGLILSSFTDRHLVSILAVP